MYVSQELYFLEIAIHYVVIWVAVCCTLRTSLRTSLTSCTRCLGLLINL